MTAADAQPDGRRRRHPGDPGQLAAVGSTTDLVGTLRDAVIPAAIAGSDVHVHVGGLTASSIDVSDRLSARLPIFIGAVLVLSFLLLMAVFRSLLVPLKAVVMNLLSIGAAYGVVVAVFQWGWLERRARHRQTGPIEPFVPMMMFAILFGLSMDYEVFLLSRIREEYDRTGDNALAVADGLAATARVITAAALIMVTVFGSFVLGDAATSSCSGSASRSAILLDATVVRMVLVPATMELLGDRNWWFPRWLDRIIPRLHVEAGRRRRRVRPAHRGGKRDDPKPLNRGRRDTTRLNHPSERSRGDNISCTRPHRPDRAEPRRPRRTADYRLRHGGSAPFRALRPARRPRLRFQAGAEHV